MKSNITLEVFESIVIEQEAITQKSLKLQENLAQNTVLLKHHAKMGWQLP